MEDPQERAVWAGPVEPVEPVDAPAKQESEGRKPTRWIALVLCLASGIFGGTVGVGQCYLGFERRARLWVGGVAAAVLLCVLLVSAAPGIASLAVLLALIGVGVLGPLLDVALAPRERFASVSVRHVAVFWILSALALMAVKLVARSMVIEAFKVPSGAMLPTIRIGDHVFADHLRVGPKLPFTDVRLGGAPRVTRGDIIVFEYPDPNPANERQDFIKRAVALEGDVLEVDAGHPILNGWRVPSCRVGSYVAASSEGNAGELWVEFLGDTPYLIWLADAPFQDRRQGPYRVPKGEVWVLGDNRNNSSDSRAWAQGRGAGVPFALVKGRATFVWLAFEGGSVNWSRTGIKFDADPRLPQDAPLELASELAACLAKRPAVTTPPSAP